jgi:L-asparaginase II
VLRDEKERIRAVLGHTNLEITRTGSVEQRSASSLVLFDKDGKVMWTAP